MKTRSEIWQEIKHESQFDIVIIGGGASGLGVALDAVSRGFKVLCVEQNDFGKGTSSKATKILHGGVRYLANGDVSLVYEALRERTLIIENAPHLSTSLPFIIPIYNYWDALQYYVGLTIYDLLAGKKSLGRSKWVGKAEVLKKLPNINPNQLKGGVIYYDGQFDDTRLCIDTVNTIRNHGGIAINYVKFEDFIFENGRVKSVLITDQIGGEKVTVHTSSVVNASGIFYSDVMEKTLEKSDLKIVPSRGSHIVLDKSFLESDHAIMIPKTSDGRVLFLIPWHHVLIVGTTDTVASKFELDPKPTKEDIDFILKNAQSYLKRKPTREDIKSTFAGLRPLAAPKSEKHKSKEISRSHKVVVNHTNLFSLLGGKWTTYRKMGYDTLEKIIKSKVLPNRPSTSAELKISNPNSLTDGAHIHPQLPYTWAEIDRIIDQEMVEKAEDVLARRTRCIFIDKKATLLIFEQVLQRIAVKKNWSNDRLEKERRDFADFASSF